MTACHLCGKGPQLPHCDAAVHRTNQHSRLQEQAHPVTTTPTRTAPDFSRLLDAEEGRQHLTEALKQNSAWRVREIRALRAQGVTLEEIGRVLGISKAGVGNLLARDSQAS